MAVRTFEDPEFSKMLCKAVAEIETGLIDARLGALLLNLELNDTVLNRLVAGSVIEEANCNGEESDS